MAAPRVWLIGNHYVLGDKILGLATKEEDGRPNQLIPQHWVDEVSWQREEKDVLSHDGTLVGTNNDPFPVEVSSVEEASDLALFNTEPPCELKECVEWHEFGGTEPLYDDISSDNRETMQQILDEVDESVLKKLAGYEHEQASKVVV